MFILSCTYLPISHSLYLSSSIPIFLIFLLSILRFLFSFPYFYLSDFPITFPFLFYFLFSLFLSSYLPPIPVILLFSSNPIFHLLSSIPILPNSLPPLLNSTTLTLSTANLSVLLFLC